MQRHGLNTRARSSQSWVILVLLSGTLFLIYRFLKKPITLNNTGEPIQTSLYNLFKGMGYSDLLSKCFVAQSAHETAGFTSIILKTNNNLFGMKYAGQSQALGEKNGYAYYSDYGKSAEDLQRWYNTHRAQIFSFPLYIKTISDYVSFLKNRGYYEAPESEYLAGCLYFYNKYFST
jgi:hypothetical protein